MVIKEEESFTSRKRAIDELLKGQEIATHLQSLLKKPSGSSSSSSSSSSDHDRSNCATTLSVQQVLAEKIARNFTQVISILSATSDQPAASHVDSLASDLDSGESTKRSPALKDRRGCYKRRKGFQTRTVVAPTTEDGQAWRKYGQKNILNAKNPRSYFRCTRKYDQGCKATKQVQKLERENESESMYQITYIGNHTCRDRSPLIEGTAPDHEINFTEYSKFDWESCLNGCFGSGKNNITLNPEKEQQYSYKEETLGSDLSTDNNTCNNKVLNPLCSDDHGNDGDNHLRVSFGFSDPDIIKPKVELSDCSQVDSHDHHHDHENLSLDGMESMDDHFNCDFQYFDDEFLHTSYL